MLDEVFAVAAVYPYLPDRGVVSGAPVENWVPTTESCTLAAVTSTARRRPRASVTMLRFRPTIFLPVSVPWLETETLVAAFTLCASITHADGSLFRPSCSRTNSGDRSLVLLVMVTPAHAQESLAARELLFRLALPHPEIAIVWADSACARNGLVPWAKQYLDITINTVRRPPDAKGFVVLPRRWAVERCWSSIMRARRHCRDQNGCLR